MFHIRDFEKKNTTKTKLKKEIMKIKKRKEENLTPLQRSWIMKKKQGKDVRLHYERK